MDAGNINSVSHARSDSLKSAFLRTDIGPPEPDVQRVCAAERRTPNAEPQTLTLIKPLLPMAQRRYDIVFGSAGADLPNHRLFAR